MFDIFVHVYPLRDFWWSDCVKMEQSCAYACSKLSGDLCQVNT